MILAFDEVICKGTSFKGNTIAKSIFETKLILEFIIHENCFTDLVNRNICLELLNIISNTICIKDFENNYIVETTQNLYILGG